ncbi:MAG: flagellar basal body-associated FliL family protein [Armatimonadetes bacterium]|nr:flagellar basal body-associated FliL family protein [Armatimonadota bacterium]
MHRTRCRSGRKIVLAVVITGTLAAGLVAGLVLAPRVTANRGWAAEGGKNGDAKVAPTQTEEEKPQIVVLGEFTVNVRANGALRYLQTEVALSLSGLSEPKGGHGGHGGAPSAPSLPEAEMALAKDRVVAVLSAADFRDAGTPEGREALKRQLAAAIGKALPSYKVHEVLFTSFVMQ